MDSDPFLTQVDQLCCAYATTPPDTLLPQCKAALNVYSVLQARREDAGTDIAVARGWLTLLAACLLQDAGRLDKAASVAHLAGQIGEEAGHPPIVGWAREIDAWQANTAGRYGDAVQIARAAADQAGRHGVAVQLRFQEAMGLARLGDFHAAWAALLTAEQLLASLPSPEHPENHFACDRPKLAFYATKVADVSGHDRGVMEYGTETLLYCQAGEGETLWPMRVSEVQLALAHMHARQKRLDAAAGYGMQALSHSRICAPTLLGRARELQATLAQSSSRMVRDFDRLLRDALRQHVIEV